MKLLKSVSLTVAVLGVLALPALADWHGRGGGWGGGGGYRGGYCGGGPRVSIGIGVPLFAPAPYYAPTYYAPVVYASRPVVIGREVGDDVVVDVQRSLARKGYYRGVIDGDLGPRSRAAIREWQADCGLPVTGQVDTRTLRSLALL